MVDLPSKNKFNIKDSNVYNTEHFSSEPSCFFPYGAIFLMNTAIETLWEDVLSVLKPQMNDESFDLWFRPIKALSMEGSRLVLQVPNAFFADWLRDHYQTRIESLLKERSGEVINLSFSVLRPVEELVKPRHPTPLSAPIVAAAPVIPPQDTFLNGRYTFETFVVGHSNRFAQAASQA